MEQTSSRKAVILCPSDPLRTLSPQLAVDSSTVRDYFHIANTPMCARVISVTVQYTHRKLRLYGRLTRFCKKLMACEVSWSNWNTGTYVQLWNADRYTRMLDEIKYNKLINAN